MPPWEFYHSNENGRDITQFIMEMLRDRKEPIPPSDLLDAARCNVKPSSSFLHYCSELISGNIGAD